MAHRGSALILVVVLVLLLAMMGTAFLVATRLSREQITGTGSAAMVARPNTWPDAVVPPNTLENAAQNQVAPVVVAALQNAILTGGSYRDPAQPDQVGFGNTPELRVYAARTPYLYAVTPTTDIRWPNITHLSLALPAGVITNFYLPANTGPGKPNAAFPLAPPDTAAVSLSAMQGVRIGSLPITYNTANYASIPALAGRTRVFPAFLDAAGAVVALAADADGDGVADSSLQQVDPTLVPYSYLAPPLSADGQTHPISYWYGVRIIDNAGAVNVNTAWRSQADRNFAGTDILGATLERAMLGTFRPNVGLYEFLESMVPGAGADVATLDAFRMDMAGPAVAGQSLPSEAAASGPPVPALRTDVQFATQGDALENQLARRLTNPGLNSASTTATQMLPYVADFDSASIHDLAYRFLMRNATASPVRTHLQNGVDVASVNFGSSLIYKDSRYYGASQYDFWFHTGLDWNDYWRRAFFKNDRTVAPGPEYVNANVNYGGPGAGALVVAASDAIANTVSKTMRHMLVTENPISIRSPFHQNAYTNLPAAMKGAGANLLPPPPAGDVPAKVAVNVATQGALWRAFWETMVSDTDPGTPAGANPAVLPVPQNITVFSSALRWPAASANLETGAQTLLRAAQAAANLVSLRDKPAAAVTNTISSFPVVVGGIRRAGSATVYGLQPQLFITEVYVSNDNVTDTGAGTNPKGYYAIELFNPYASTPIDLRDLYVCSLRRVGSVRTAGSLAMARLSTVAGANFLAAHGYLVLDNLGGADANHAKFRPQNALLTGTPAIISDLHSVQGEEFVIFRVPNSAYAPSGPLDALLVPVDAFDFLGMPDPQLDPVSGDMRMEAWHYVRQNDSSGANNAWYAAYPGKYAVRGARCQEGTVYHNWNVAAGATTESEPVGWIADPVGARPVNNAAAVALGAQDAVSTCGIRYQIPFNLEDWPSRLPAAGLARAPFGAFMRDGDILQVPFIGASRVLDDAGNLVDIIPVTMDAAFADDGTADADQAIGRFISTAASKGQVVAPDNQDWCGRLFTYVTAIQNPDTNTMPNINGVQASAFATVPGLQAVQNAIPATDLNVQGKVNINTAPWQVLATLPLVRIGDPGITTPQQAADATRALAKAIVRFRDVDGSAAAGIQPPHGPFASIIDLCLVPAYTADPTHELGEDVFGPNAAFRDAAGGAATADSGWANGDLSAGATGTGDGLVNDFEERTLAFTRISNLITTRSDAFTAYVVVQAWIDAGTQYPVMLSETRSVMTIDRSQMNPITPTIDPVAHTRYWTVGIAD